jgi:hypothetical protein
MYSYNYVEELEMIKQLALIAMAIGIGAVFLGTTLAPAFAACTGDPHETFRGSFTQDPHDPGDTGNPHDIVIPGSGTSGEVDACPGAK